MFFNFIHMWFCKSLYAGKWWYSFWNKLYFLKLTLFQIYLQDSQIMWWHSLTRRLSSYFWCFTSETIKSSPWWRKFCIYIKIECYILRVFIETWFFIRMRIALENRIETTFMSLKFFWRNRICPGIPCFGAADVSLNLSLTWFCELWLLYFYIKHFCR